MNQRGDILLEFMVYFPLLLLTILGAFILTLNRVHIVSDTADIAGKAISVYDGDILSGDLALFWNAREFEIGDGDTVNLGSKDLWHCGLPGRTVVDANTLLKKIMQDLGIFDVLTQIQE